MTRGLPYSLAFHTITLLLIFLFGSSVSRVPLESPKTIRVKMVYLPRTRPEPTPAVEPPAEQPVVQKEAPKEVVPELPPKELPQAKTETKKPDPVPEEKAAAPEAAPAVEVPVTSLAMGPSVEGTDSDFPFAWYLARVEGLIARNWNPRQLGFGKKSMVSCAVHFQVGKNGAVSQVTLFRNSGVGVFDRESLRAVQTTRLPPLPPQYSGSSLGVTFIFNLEPGS